MEHIRKNIILSILLFIAQMPLHCMDYYTKELVIAISLDNSIIKDVILPETKKETVIYKMSNPTHLTLMWLKDIPMGNTEINNLRTVLIDTVNKFLFQFSEEHKNDFCVVVNKIEKGNGGVYLLPTEMGNKLLTELILELKTQVEIWKCDNPTVPVNYYKYFDGDYFMPHVTILETAKANSIFTTMQEKAKYGQEIEKTIQENKPEGFGGVPIQILNTTSWYQ